MRIESEYAHDQALRDKRIERYQRLFHVSRRIPRYWLPTEEPTRQDLLQFCEEFHDWYFGEEAGGLFLTPQANALYFQIQNALAEAGRRDLDMTAESSGGHPQSALSIDESKELRELADNLRHQLAQDIGTTHPPRLAWTRLGPALQPPRSSRG
jgi:hypothetical protein